MMTDKAQTTTADAADRHRNLLALAMLSMSLMFLIQAVIHVVEPTAGNYLDFLVPGLALLAVGLCIPVASWKLRKLPKGERALYFSPDGFVPEILNRAHKASWSVTLLLLMVLNIIIGDKDYEGYLQTLPTQFFLQLTLGAMLGVMASVFLFLNRGDGTDEAEERSRA